MGENTPKNHYNHNHYIMNTSFDIQPQTVPSRILVKLRH